jgi:arabinan endo-1,5-alpha-L-arabinosidase
MIYPNAIDPHVFFDKEGNLWMVYGSYFGGIYILKMDPKTGLPFENQRYGEKLAGGFHAPMEGPYILYSPHTDYYYLFLSFGTLSTDGGYNIRVARSRNPNGPYFDSMNKNMIDAKSNSFDSYGTKLVGNFLFNDSNIGYVSPGHNSAFYDSDLRKYFIFFHTRFPNRGEVHNLRVHQLLFNEDGWPLIAPHRYSGIESYEIEQEQVSGTYQFINHGRDTSPLIKESTYIELNPNGSILIDDNVKGNWYLNQENQITLILEEKTYKGIILKQWDNGLKKEVISFTALSSKTGITIWGSKL